MAKQAGCDWVEKCVKDYMAKGHSKEEAEKFCWGAYNKQQSKNLCDFCDKTALVVGDTIFGEPAKMCRVCYEKFGVKRGTKI
jgi:hypothetical protein